MWLRQVQTAVDRIELLESLAGIHKSLDEFAQGQGILLDEAFDQLRQKHDIPD